MICHIKACAGQVPWQSALSTCSAPMYALGCPQWSTHFNPSRRAAVHVYLVQKFVRQRRRQYCMYLHHITFINIALTLHRQPAQWDRDSDTVSVWYASKQCNGMGHSSLPRCAQNDKLLHVSNLTERLPVLDAPKMHHKHCTSSAGRWAPGCQAGSVGGWIGVEVTSHIARLQVLKDGSNLCTCFQFCPQLSLQV